MPHQVALVVFMLTWTLGPNTGNVSYISGQVQRPQVWVFGQGKNEGNKIVMKISIVILHLYVHFYLFIFIINIMMIINNFIIIFLIYFTVKYYASNIYFVCLVVILIFNNNATDPQVKCPFQKIKLNIIIIIKLIVFYKDLFKLRIIISLIIFFFFIWLF